MNEKAKMLFKNLNYTISANFLILGISVILNLVVPKFIGVKEYSFWQLYVFYSGYVGFFHLGWLEGIYLKIGGEEYENLNKKSLGTQFWYLVVLQSILAGLIIVYTNLFYKTSDREFIFIFTALNLVVSNCKFFVLYILQATNRIKEYAQVSRNDRYIYIIGIGLYIFFHGKSFLPLIAMDVISKTIILIWGLSRIKDMIFLKKIPLNQVFPEIKDNIKIGSNLMISNIVSMLILGISRLMVERQWSIETFGKLSFTLSISNMFMTFINAVGVVMFPLLRRSNKESLPLLYIKLRNVFVPITYGILIFFYPIKLILNYWLPEYSQSLFFMGILFPIVIYEGRMALLVSTYLKAIRKEKIILLSNVITLVIASLFSFVSVFIFKDIYLTIIVIVFSLAFRCMFAENLLVDVMHIKLETSVIIEIGLTVVFVLTNIFCSYLVSLYIYVICFFVYLLVSRKIIMSSLKQLMNFIKK